MIRFALVLALVLGAACGKSAEPAKPGVLHVRVTDGANGPPIAARVLLWIGDEPLHFGRRELYDGKRQATGSCMLAGGALGTWDGLVLVYGDAELPVGGDDGCEPTPAIPLGTYRVWAWRGAEYERWEGSVSIGSGQKIDLNIPLARAWTPRGALAADLHVHAQASNDSGVPNRVRVMTEMAAGTQVIALSDHNSNGDLSAEIAALSVGDRVVSIPSNELGNDRLHLGVYPVTKDTSPTAEDVKDWDAGKMMAWGHAQTARSLVQVNHPRFRVYSLFDSSGWNGVTWPPPFPLDFDAVEVLAGYTAFNAPKDRRIDEGVRDFYTLIGHGALVAGVGNSDTHHLNGVHDALARTYVFSDDPRVSPFDLDAFLRAIKTRRAIATTGPWLDVEAVAVGARAPAGPGQAITAKGGHVELDVELDQAAWCHADQIRVRVGKPDGSNEIVKTIAVAGAKAREHVIVEVGARDTWIGVDAGGDTPLPVEMTGTYQLEKGRPGVTPYAIINPILIDADGDGRVKFGNADVGVE
ncbi:MAG TPA: CehA/McbA family metallohydrolase [Kofleriaceae bacterium]|nr:CehA/McbA family metallohydrolase [Kofleriaceae bacterium]